MIIVNSSFGKGLAGLAGQQQTMLIPLVPIFWPNFYHFHNIFGFGGEMV